jgi:hypothetical protein
MDLLASRYPLYPPNPEAPSDSEESLENHEYIKKLDNINDKKKRKRTFTIDDFCLKYSDDMWYIWCIIHDYSRTSNLLNNLTYSKFCELCYENSTKY